MNPQEVGIPLTQRQSEVVTLIAAGYTNRGIAQSLAISERTVEHHVAAILARLKLTSRTQIAIWTIKRQPIPEP